MLGEGGFMEEVDGKESEFPVPTQPGTSPPWTIGAGAFMVSLSSSFPLLFPTLPPLSFQMNLPVPGVILAVIVRVKPLPSLD